MVTFQNSVNLEIKICSECGNKFTPKQNFHKICYNCFKLSRNKQAGSGGFSLSDEKRDKFKKEFYPDGYYKDGKIDSALFDETADNVAKSFVVIKPNGAKTKISFSKIRQYYDEANRLHSLIMVAKENEENVEIKLKLLIAKAIFDFGRKGQNLVPENFVYFLQVNEKLLESKERGFAKNLEIFKKHFEAIMAYGKGKMYFNK